MVKKLLFIYNPISGNGTIMKNLDSIMKVLNSSNFAITSYQTKARFDGYRKIKEDGQNYDRIVIAGGDGSFHECLNAILSNNIKTDIGYIPAGTMNDFAATNNIPKNVIKAAKIAVNNEPSLIDAPFIATNHGKDIDFSSETFEFFSYVAGFGIGTKIAYETAQSNKKTLGALAYIIDTLKQMTAKNFRAESRYLTIQTDNKTYEGSFVFALIYNAKSIAGVKSFVLPNVDLKDGFLEAIFVRKPYSFFEFYLMVRALLFADFMSPYLLPIRSSKFLITGKNIHWTLDGEDGRIIDKALISAKKQALSIVLP